MFHPMGHTLPKAKPLQPGSRVCRHLPPRTRASFGPDTQPTPAEGQASAFNPWGRSRIAGSRTPLDPSGSQACDWSSGSRAQKGSATRQLCSSIAHTARPSGLLQQMTGEGSVLDHHCSRLPARMAVKWPLRNRDGHCSRHSQRSSNARNLCWAAADCPCSRRALQTASTRGQWRMALVCLCAAAGVTEAATTPASVGQCWRKCHWPGYP